MTVISIIVAMGRNREIGSGGTLPWDLPSDMEHFMKTTMGHPIIMGRKTHESIGRALPGRMNIVLSRRKDTFAPGCIVVQNSKDALELARVAEGGEEIFVIGGGEIFQEFMDQASKLYITKIEKTFKGDTFFPEIGWDNWSLVGSEQGTMDDKNQYLHEFQVYEKNI